jgi:hypothetical protein
MYSSKTQQVQEHQQQEQNITTTATTMVGKKKAMHQTNKNNNNNNNKVPIRWIVIITTLNLMGNVIFGRISTSTLLHHSVQFFGGTTIMPSPSSLSTTAASTAAGLEITTTTPLNPNHNPYYRPRAANPSLNAATATTATTTTLGSCLVASSTEPAQFTDYTEHAIVPQMDHLFDVDPIPIIRHTTNITTAMTMTNNDTSNQQQPQLQPFATCSIVHLGPWNHFPHTAQQIYRCWSFWQAYSTTHQPVLVAVGMGGGTRPFIQGMYDTLQTMGVLWRDWNQVTPTELPLLTNDASLSVVAKTQQDFNPAAGSDVFSGYKMLSTHHAVTFREEVLSALNIDDAGSCHGSSSQPTKTGPPRFGILNRLTNRRFLNEKNLIAALIERYDTSAPPTTTSSNSNYYNSSSNRSTSHNSASTTTTTTTSRTRYPFSLKIFSMEDKSFAEQVEWMSDIDILISPHGAALVDSIFLPPCAGILELTPLGFEHPQFFGSLAALSQHAHATLYTGGIDKREEVGQWSRTGGGRDAARSHDVCPNMTLVMDAVEQLERQWRTCCRQERTKKQQQEPQQQQRQRRPRQPSTNLEAEENEQLDVATCSVLAQNGTEPAQFTNYYSQSITTNITALFDLDIIPQVRQTRPNQKPYVTCALNPISNWRHFAHTAQQLYRCWSLWQAHPNHQPVLLAEPMAQTFTKGVFHIFWKLGVQLRRLDQVTSSNETVLDGDTSISGRSKTEVDPDPASGSDVFQGFKMLSSHHAVTFRDQFLPIMNITDGGYCHQYNGLEPSWNDDMPTGPRPPSIGILNRQGSRRILNVPEIVQALAEQYSDGYHDDDNTTTTTTNRDPPHFIKVFEMENQSYKEQVQAFSDVDILVAPHGAALVHVIFLPKCAGVVELNPMGFEHSKFFGSLAALSNHAHATLYVGGGKGKSAELAEWSTTLRGRAKARRANLCPNVTLVVDAVMQLEEQWRMCCQRLVSAEGGSDE